MSIPIGIFPVCQWNHREFDGIDPWAGNRPVRWSIVVYRMKKGGGEPVLGASPSRGDPSNNVPRELAVGIHAPQQNRYRVLPLALQEMWRAGQVRDQDLPRLLHELEEKLWPIDYPGQQGWLKFGAAFCGPIALVFLIWWLLFVPHTRHVIEFPSAERWLRQPLRNESSVRVDGRVSSATIVSLPAPVSVPSALHAEGSGQLELLAVIPAAHEKRLALLADRGDLRRLSGVVLRSGTAGLPSALPASLKQRFPDLNTEYVLCGKWNWPDAIDDRDYTPWKFVGGLYAATGGGFVGILLLVRKRRRSLAERCLALLG